MSSNQIVTYAHQSAPEGNRFVGTADSIPVWAVNVEYDDGKPKNWLGLPTHPTDEYVHWNEKNPQQKMTELRIMYDNLAQLGLSKEIDVLMKQAYQTGKMDESEQNQGENI